MLSDHFFRKLTLKLLSQHIPTQEHILSLYKRKILNIISHLSMEVVLNCKSLLFYVSVILLHSHYILLYCGQDTPA